MGDCINMHLLQYNNNKTTSTKQILNLQKSCNSVIGNLNDWNMYIKGLMISSIDLPIANMKQYMLDVTKDKLIFTLSLYDSTAYNFFVTGVNDFYFGIDEDSGNPGNYKGICVYLKWVPEASISKSNDSYYLLHYVQNFLDLVNTALKTALTAYVGPVGLSSSASYFYYSPGNPYKLQLEDLFVSSTIELYFNSFLKSVLDGFRVTYLSETDLSNLSYNGMNYLFNKNNTLNNYYTGASNYWIYTAEFACINSLSTYLGITMIVGAGLSGVRDTIFDYFDSNNTNVNLQTKKILKVLDFTIDNYNSIVGSNYLQFESIFSADSPINFLDKNDLNSFTVAFYLINNDGTFTSISLPSNATVKLNILFKRR